MMTSIELVAFGQIAAITGSHLLVDPTLADTNALQKWLFQQYPALANVKYAIAINKKIISENQPLQPGASIALLPPFSGG